MSALVRAANQWQAYTKGWGHAASGRAFDVVLANFDVAEIRDAYNQGYADAREARRVALHTAADAYGYKPSVLRLADGDAEAR